jgi:HSP20 family protein
MRVAKGPGIGFDNNTVLTSSRKKMEKSMNILKHKKILKGLGQQIDLINTLGGGVSMAQIAVRNKKDCLEVRVAAPGLGPEAMQVIVDHNRLTVLGVLPAHQGHDLRMPLFQRVMDIPFQVDVTRIRARYEGNSLKVILPYSEGRTNGPRAIEIEF